jgi:hypothetical protein
MYSGGHSEDQHIDQRKGKNTLKCPNCNGNHQVDNNCYRTKIVAAEKQLKQSENTNSANAVRQKRRFRSGEKSNERGKQRGAPLWIIWPWTPMIKVIKANSRASKDIMMALMSAAVKAGAEVVLIHEPSIKQEEDQWKAKIRDGNLSHPKRSQMI